MKRRLELDLRQKDVALRLRVNEWTIGNWEKDITTPAVRYYPRIIEFLGYYPFAAPQTLGERLLAKRRYTGLSRKRLARKLAIDEGTLTRWEEGASFPVGDHAQRIEMFLSTIS